MYFHVISDLEAVKGESVMVIFCHVGKKNYHIDSVVVCTDLWGKRARKTGGGGYRSDVKEPMWCNGSTLAQNARDVGSSPALGTVFPIVITFTAIVKGAWLLVRYFLGPGNI